jgi:tetratricopeptide (TPR) repeat protein
MSYAHFLTHTRHEDERADQMFRRAIEADPQDLAAFGNYARFLAETRHEDEQADQMYRRAIEADPEHLAILGGYAYSSRRPCTTTSGRRRCTDVRSKPTPTTTARTLLAFCSLWGRIVWLKMRSTSLLR